VQLVGRFEEAFALLDEAITTTSDTPLKGRASLAQGRGLLWAGSPHEAHALLAEAASRLEPLDRATSVLLRTESANTLMPAAYPQRFLAVAEQARAAAAEIGGEPLVVATAAVAQALVLVGEARRSTAVLAEANVDAADPLTRAHFMLLRASSLAILERYDESRAILDEVVATGRQQSAPSLLPFPLAALAYVDFRTGRWTRAYAGATASVDLARETGQVPTLTFCLSALAQVEAGTGRARECNEHAIEALQIARSLGGDAIVLYAGAARLLSALGTGAFDDGIVIGESVARLFDERGYGEPAVAQWHGELVEAYVRAGRPSDAANLLERFEELARETGGAWALGVAARCRALLAADPAFENEFELALQELGRTSAPFERARSELCLGERRRRARRRTDARHPLPLRARDLRSAWSTAVGGTGTH
jgi:tetratricopeptide (TPR) repeat protein